MTVVMVSGLTVGNGPGGDGARGDHGMQVFGGSNSIEVVSGSLKLAAGEMRAYQPDWLALSQRCAASVPDGYGVQGPYSEVVSALHHLREVAYKASRHMIDTWHYINNLEQSLVHAANNYEEAESQNLATIGFSDEDATWGVLMNMAEASPELSVLITAGGTFFYATESVRQTVENGFKLVDGKSRGAKTVRDVFSGLTSFAPRIPLMRQEKAVAVRTDASKLTTWIEQQQLAGEGHGSIMVSKAVTSSGEHRWIVTIPGTNMSKGSAWGLPRMAQAFENETEDVRKAVGDALKKAGAKSGEGVYLSGFSQGGKHALNLAHDDTFKKQYKLKGTFTAGAPHGDDDPPTDAPQLMLIDPDDAIPAFGATAPLKVSPNRVAVFSRGEDRVKTDNPGPLGADHGSHNYLDHARVADVVDDPALADIKEKMQLDDLKITETHRFKTSTGADQ